MKRSYSVGPSRQNLEETGFFSDLFYWWALPMIIKLSNKELKVDDIPKNLLEDNSAKLGDELKNAWNKELLEAKSEQSGKTPSFQSALVNVFGTRVILLGIIAFIKDSILSILQGVLLGLLIRFATPMKETESTFNIYQLKISLLLILVTGISIILQHKYTFMAKHLGMKMRIATSGLVYHKSLKVTQGALSKSGIGQVSNFLANDVTRFDSTIEYLNYVWLGPISIIMTTGVIWYYVGYTSLIGVALALVILPFQGVFAKQIGKLRGKVAKATDNRLKILSEIIDRMLLIKMSSYEASFLETINDARKNEISFIRCKAAVQSVMLSILMVAPKIIVLITLAVCVFTGHILDAEKIFVILTLYGRICHICTHLFPNGLTNMAELLTAIKRIQTFLLLEEKDFQFQDAIVEKDYTLSPRIEICSISAKWDNDLKTEETIRNISLDLSGKKFIAVSGSVAAGKSTLLQAMLGEIPIISGCAKKSGKIAYTPQDPWIFSGSIRENILLGTVFNNNRYQSVLNACALQDDLNLFEHGDLTVVGDKGSTLSGGQKARISLARAVYQDADVYLLDDPLGSVDNKVANHIFHNCILGLLKSKAVLLVTYQLNFLESADEILILENGNIKVQGGHNNLVSANLMPHNSIDEDENSNDESKNKFLKKVSEISHSKIRQAQQDRQQAESESKGNVGLGLFLSYLKIGNGNILILTLMLLYMISQIVMSSSDLLIQLWAEAEGGPGDSIVVANSTIGPEYVHESLSSQSQQTWASRIYLYTLSFLIGILLVVLFSRTITHYILCLKSSAKLHHLMAKAIIFAPMKFFEENSSGRIMNRMARDIGTIDEALPWLIYILLELILITLGSIVLITLMNYYLMIPSILVLIIFFTLRSLYIKASTKISRLEATTKSPVFSQISSTLRGLSTIRAFHMETNLQEKFDKVQDIHSSVFYLYIGMTRCLAMTLQLLGFVYFTVVTLSFMFLSTDPSKVGLAVSSALNISTILAYLVSFSAELENRLVSVERAQEYTNIAPENEDMVEVEASPNWLKNGGIKFDNVTIKYRADLDVVHKVSFSIEPHEKIGIIGRTGSGKTSLINTLFRIVTPSSGVIYIDGISIDKVGLSTLRSSISIIPQSPQLFTGSLRRNLDPCNQFNDSEIWETLVQVHLEEKIRQNFPAGLDMEIHDGGSNFSQGELQLFCLARALLRKSKILVLDEATAHVDMETESLIQETLKEWFSNCTIISVAHRIVTVAESDRIMVLDSGKIMEFDVPYALLQNPNSLFSKLVQQTGLETLAKVFQIAQSKYEYAKRMNESQKPFTILQLPMPNSNILF